VRGIRRIELAAQGRPAGELVVGGVGLLLGFALATLAAFALVRLPFVGIYLLPVVYLALGYLFALVGARKHRQVLATLGVGQRADSSDPKPRVQEERRGRKLSQQRAGVLVDTSAIIDGRLADLMGTGFLDRELIVPVFVLHELQAVADSADPQRRARGRRGMDVVTALRKGDHLVSTPDIDVPGIAEVDAKLVRVAHERGLAVLTTDYNLNKIARIQGVSVLNINELANALKPAVLPGESLRVKVLREGKEAAQGVGYLDDGTMIVIEGGRDRVGETIEVEVTSVLQSPSGKMIFTRLA